MTTISVAQILQRSILLFCILLLFTVLEVSGMGRYPQMDNQLLLLFVFLTGWTYADVNMLWGLAIKGRQV